MLEFVRPGGAGVVNADGPELMDVVAGLAEKPAVIVGFGEGEEALVRVVRVEQSFDGLTFTLNDRARFGLPLLGRHNAPNRSAIPIPHPAITFFRRAIARATRNAATWTMNAVTALILSACRAIVPVITRTRIVHSAPMRAAQAAVNWSARFTWTGAPSRGAAAP